MKDFNHIVFSFEDHFTFFYCKTTQKLQIGWLIIQLLIKNIFLSRCAKSYQNRTYRLYKQAVFIDSKVKF